MGAVEPTPANPWSGLEEVPPVGWSAVGPGVGRIRATRTPGGEVLHEVVALGPVPVAIELWPILVAAVRAGDTPFELAVIGRDPARGLVWVETEPSPLEALAGRLR